MAEIFVARQDGLQGFKKKIVIKVIRENLSAHQEFIQMFLNEAILAARLTHSNIAQIYDLGRIGNSYFISMEYVNGHNMREVIKKADAVSIPFPLEYSLKITSAVCEGLYYAHRFTEDNGTPLNIVHRDITPENIMVSFDGAVKILDFGIAKAANLIGETRTGEIKGKIAYMSPEQIAGKAVDARSDLFSLGVVAYEWVTAHRLFGEGSDADILRNTTSGKIYPPSYFRAGLPEAVESILLRAVQRNREERYQSAWDMQYDIDQFLSKQEFVPSNIHLSNFIKQLYADEFARGEPGTLCASNSNSLPGDFATPGEDSSPGEPGAPTILAQQEDADTSFEEIHSIEFEVGDSLYRKLKSLADKNGVSIPTLVGDMVRQWTKYV
jgi:eukaryotic-like serine/threonine-protein kinase